MLSKNYFKYVFLIQARTNSTRYPGKILEKVFGTQTLIEIVYERVLLSAFAQKENVYVLSTDNSSDNKLIELLKKKDISYFRGNELNVYQRFFDFIMEKHLNRKSSNYIIRICSDNPFIDPIFIDELIHYIENVKDDSDYFSFKDDKERPAILTHYGFFCEIIRTDSFLRANKYLNTDYEKEHVTSIFYSSELFKMHFIEMPHILYKLPIRLTFDTSNDLNVIKSIFKDLGKNSSYIEIINYLRHRNDLVENMQKNILLNLDK